MSNLGRVARNADLVGHSRAAWRGGDQHHRPTPDAQVKKQARRFGPLFGDSDAVYATRRAQRGPLVLGTVPHNTDLYRAHTAPLLPPTHRPRFNPWLLLLELLDDPRLRWAVNGDNSTRFVQAIQYLSWVTPCNIHQQRSLLLQYLLKRKCFAVETSEPSASDELNLAQLVQLSQDRWPRLVDQKYEGLLSVPSLTTGLDKWSRAWLATNCCMIELNTAYRRHRILNSDRMGVDSQMSKVIWDAFDDAPGLVLNTIICWRPMNKPILNRYAMVERMVAQLGPAHKEVDADLPSQDQEPIMYPTQPE
ncbi:hypothetical protein GGF46_003470 [Coemansia sp. RSA 552]|nr:hypothetical protein GGF46_003470 [Coemansia sp. RSA 552]